MARGAIEDNVKRVEKIHHVSTVMLEEATYDPSLRFVLVALGLFVVFMHPAHAQQGNGVNSFEFLVSEFRVRGLKKLSQVDKLGRRN